VEIEKKLATLGKKKNGFQESIIIVHSLAQPGTINNLITLILLSFALLHFTDITIFFYKLEICSNPTSSKTISTTFPTVFVHFVSLCHTLIILATFQTFSLFSHFLDIQKPLFAGIPQRYCGLGATIIWQQSEPHEFLVS